MNSSERNIVRLAFCMLVLGLVVRILPWGLPSIESYQVGDALIVDAETESFSNEKDVADKVTVPAAEKKSAADVKNRKKTPQLPVHVNSASVEELCALKGVGPKLAQKIVGVREASGPFKSGEDLQKVPGIGKKKLEGLLPGVIFD